MSTTFLPAGVSVLHAYYLGGEFGLPPKRYEASTSSSIKQTVNASPSLGFSQASFSTGQYPEPMAIGDFNGDGTPDLAIGYPNGAVSILLGEGNGYFTNGSTFSPGQDIASIATGDFNNDGKTDLAIVDFVGAQVCVYLGDGNGAFTQASGSPIQVGFFPEQVTVADFNGDGFADLAVGGFGSGSTNVTVLLGDGIGTFTLAPGSPFLVGTDVFAMAVGDFNVDGIADLALGDETDGLTVLLGNGSGGFTTAAGSPITVPGIVSMAVADFDLDGYLDLAVAFIYEDDQMMVLLGKGDGGFRTAAGSPFGVYDGAGSPVFMAVGDFNGDGTPDLAVPGGPSNNLTVLLGKGNGEFTGSPFQIGNYPNSVVVGDFNGDGKADLAVTEVYDNNVRILLAAAKTQSITFSAIGTQTFSPLLIPIYATASSGLTVTFTSNTSAVCSVTESYVTLVGAGTCTIVASQLGNATYAAAAPVPQSFTVNPASQTIAFAGLNNVTLPAGPITLSATSTSGLAVAFASTTPSVCSVSGNTLTIAAAGTCTIQATQAGNTNYLAATPVTQSFTVGAALSPCDINQDKITDVTDVRLMIAQALGANQAVNDLTGQGVVNVVDVQIVANAALQLGCQGH